MVTCNLLSNLHSNPSESGSTIYDKIKKTVKHTLIFGIGSIANSAYGLILLPLYARLLRAAEYGILSLLMITLTLVTLVLKLGMNHAFFRQYYDSEDPARRRQVVGTALVFLVTLGAVVTAALYPFGTQFSELIFRGDPGQAKLVQLVLVTCFFEVITLIPDSILRANFKSGRYSLLNIIALAFQLLAIVYMVVFVDASAKSVVIGRLAGTAFEAVLFLWAVRRELTLSFSTGILKDLVSFGSPLVLGQLSFTLFIMIDRFFVEHYGTRRDVGVYALANTVVSVVTILVTVPFSQVWTVMRFSVMNEDGAHEYYSRVLTYIVFVSLLFALGVSAVAGDGLLLKALKSYWPCATIIPILALAAVFDCASRVLNVGLTLRKRTVFAPLVAGGALAFNTGLNFVLIPRYGPLGASISTLVSYIFFCGLRFWVSNLFFKVDYEWGRVFTLIAVGGILITAFYSIDHFRGEPPSHSSLYLSILVKLVLALSFPLILFVMGFYEDRERRKIAEITRDLIAAVR